MRRLRRDGERACIGHGRSFLGKQGVGRGSAVSRRETTPGWSTKVGGGIQSTMSPRPFGARRENEPSAPAANRGWSRENRRIALWADRRRQRGRFSYRRSLPRSGDTGAWTEVSAPQIEMSTPMAVFPVGEFPND